MRLTRTLHVTASHYPGLPGGDSDFGSTPTLYHASGCPPQLAVGSKYGQFFVYDRNKIGNGPVQRLLLGGDGAGLRALLGNAAYWPARRLLYVTNPETRGAYGAGMLAFRVNSKCRLKLAWHGAGSSGIASSPTVANGVVYYGAGYTDRLIAFDAASGKRLWTGSLDGHVVNAPSVVGGAVYSGDWGGHLHKFALPGSVRAYL